MNPRPNSTEDYTTRLVLVVHSFDGVIRMQGIQSQLHIRKSDTEKLRETKKFRDIETET